MYYMALFPIKIEQFIQMIQSRPVLWDPKHQSYYDKSVRIQAWENICSIIYEDWDELDDYMRERRVKVLQKRWTNIKDSCRKDLRIKLQPNGRRKRCRYLYSQYLSFLYPVFKNRRYRLKAVNEEQDATIPGILEVNGTEAESSPSKSDRQYHRRAMLRSKKAEEVIGGDTRIHRELVLADPQPYQQSESPHSYDPPQAVQPCLPASDPLETTFQECDADKMFLLSFLPDLKKIKEDKKFLLKSDMIMLFHKYFLQSSNSARVPATSENNCGQPTTSGTSSLLQVDDSDSASRAIKSEMIF